MASAQPQFFVDHKKGEVNELRALLRNPLVDREPNRKRDTIKKVIGYMTLGIDVSRLFSEMVMASVTKDLVVKKLIYLYLCNYAESNAELSLLAINTLQKDCHDTDPMVRGLALRSMSSLRLPNIVEYLLPCLQRGLVDPSPYVRKTAVTGVVKLWHIAPHVVRENALVDTLYKMIRDRDPQVCANCISALNELLQDEDGMALNKPLMYHLLNRLRDFSEWSQCVVLELAARYEPEVDTEVFDIMNLLEERLRHSNLAVVMATIKVFLHLTQHLPDIHRQVYERLKAPLLTLMAGGGPESAFVTLCHIDLLVSRCSDVFADEYKHFFAKYNDPSAVKTVKLDILMQLANERNCEEIVAELGEYVSDVDAMLARRAIRSIGKIGTRLTAAADLVMDALLRLLDLDIDYVASETMVMMKDLLRRYSHRVKDVIPAMSRCLRSMDDPEAKVAIIWMIGEYGAQIEEAPYILEALVDKYADENSHAVRMQLLTSTMKLFFQTPAECQSMLGRLLEAAIADASNVDVHDRALLFYRLLAMDVNEAKRVVLSEVGTVNSFAEEEESEVKDRIFEEFNSLSVIYGQPSERFIVQDAGSAVKEKRSMSAAEGVTSEGDDEDSEEEEEKEPRPAFVPPTSTSLLDLDGTAPVATAAESGAEPELELDAHAKLTPADFQKKWAGSGDVATVAGRLTMNQSATEMESRLTRHSLVCIASGHVKAQMKFYCYGCHAKTHTFGLLELLVNSSTMEIRAKVKADNADVGHIVADAVRGAFKGILVS